LILRADANYTPLRPHRGDSTEVNNLQALLYETSHLVAANRYSKVRLGVPTSRWSATASASGSSGANTCHSPCWDACLEAALGFVGHRLATFSEAMQAVIQGRSCPPQFSDGSQRAGGLNSRL